MLSQPMVRELTGGIYFGDRGRRNSKHGREAYDTEAYSVMEIERIARAAFDAAMKRRKKLISIDKANVLETSRLWRETVYRIAAEYPEVELSDMLEHTGFEPVTSTMRISTENQHTYIGRKNI